MLATKARQITETKIKKEESPFDENKWVQTQLTKIYKSIEESANVGSFFDIYDITYLDSHPKTIDSWYLINKIYRKLINDGYEVVYPYNQIYIKITW